MLCEVLSWIIAAFAEPILTQKMFTCRHYAKHPGRRIDNERIKLGPGILIELSTTIGLVMGANENSTPG